MVEFFLAIWKSRHLLWSLTRDDFRQRYVKNVLGVAWAFIQPLLTILIFWFVFQVGFKTKPVGDFPFVLWLISGMVPWFFFAEGLGTASHAVISRSYLVKKIVFRVSLLPLVQLLSAIFIHVFFLAFLFAMFLFYGFHPSLYWLQIGYYMAALSILLLGLSWITSSLMVFLKDIGEVINVILQFGFWMTPIFWPIEIIPERYHFFLNLNPLAYIINGYRNSLIYHRWFWEESSMTLYFWAVTLFVLGAGAITFRRLRPHFADVL